MVTWVFLQFLITQNFEAIQARLSLGSTHAVWKNCAGRFPNVIRFMRMNIFFVVAKTVSKWKVTFHFSLQIQKEYIIFYHIWLILCILKQVFQMAHKQIVPPCLSTPTLFFDIELVVYNFVLLTNSCQCCQGSCSLFVVSLKSCLYSWWTSASNESHNNIW